MTENKTIWTVGLVVIAAAVAGYFLFTTPVVEPQALQELDATPQNATLSGTYTCLPHLDTSGPQTMECAFGLQTDEGLYYAVDFGASPDAALEFQVGQHIIAEGNIVIKEALSSSHWQKYNMEGIFTITQMIDPIPTVEGAQGKLNINIVCEGAIEAYMTFPDTASADAFMAECVEGKHPEIINQYIDAMDLGDHVAI